MFTGNAQRRGHGAGSGALAGINATARMVFERKREAAQDK